MISLITYCFLGFYFLLFKQIVTTSSKNGGGHIIQTITNEGEPDALLKRMIVGVFYLGTAVVIVMAINNFENDYVSLTRSMEGFGFYWLVLTVISAVIGFTSAYKTVLPVNKTLHPLPVWFPVTYTGIRILFLIVYELFFRGVLLFLIARDAGVVIAVVINTILYVIVHMQNKKEMYGALIIGPILCAISLYYQSVWPSVIIHLALTISYELTLLLNYNNITKKSMS